MEFKGFRENVLTFKCSGSVKSGDLVKISASETVSAVTSGAFVGVCVGVRDGYAAVQLSGYAEVKYTGTAPTAGYSKLGAGGAGIAKSDSTNGREYLVIKVDSTNTKVGFIL